MQRSWFNSSITIDYMIAARCTLLSSITPNFIFSISCTKICVNSEGLETTHSKSESHPKICLRCERNIHALGAENVRAQKPTIRLLGRVNLRIISIIRGMLFCSGLGKTLELDTLEPALKTRLFRGNPEKFDVWLLQPECSNFMSPGAS